MINPKFLAQPGVLSFAYFFHRALPLLHFSQQQEVRAWLIWLEWNIHIPVQLNRNRKTVKDKE